MSLGLAGRLMTAADFNSVTMERAGAVSTCLFDKLCSFHMASELPSSSDGASLSLVPLSIDGKSSGSLILFPSV